MFPWVENGARDALATMHPMDQPFWASEEIEERESVRLSKLTANLLLLDSDTTPTFHKGWSRVAGNVLVTPPRHPIHVFTCFISELP